MRIFFLALLAMASSTNSLYSQQTSSFDLVFKGESKDAHNNFTIHILDGADNNSEIFSGVSGKHDAGTGAATYAMEICQDLKNNKKPGFTVACIQNKITITTPRDGIICKAKESGKSTVRDLPTTVLNTTVNSKDGISITKERIVARPASAKILSDTGYYVHNWTVNHNNLDAASGSYVYFFTNQTVSGGPPALGDNVRKCWNSKALSGGQAPVFNHATNWICVVQGTNAAAGPHVGQVTVASMADPVGDAGGGSSDVCIAPFTVNPIWMLGGIFFNFGFLNITPGFWVIGFRFPSGGQGLPLFGSNNANACLEGRIVYELQHGYNGTVNNQQYLHVVSIDEITYPNAGGISEGNPNYGLNEWGPIVGSGNVVSYSRFISFSGNAICLLSGQSIEGNGDGLELVLGIGFNIPAFAAGRENGVTDCNAAARMDFGAGGADWVSCVTSGPPGNNISFRAVDYFYAQQGDPASLGFSDTAYDIELLWSACDAPPCGSSVMGTGITGLPLGTGQQFDQLSIVFNTNPKARANIKFGNEFTGVTGSVFGALWVDGCWPSYCTDGIFLGRSELPRGATRLLNLCNSKARNVFSPGAPLLVTPVLRKLKGTPAYVETGNTVKVSVH